MEAAKNRKDVFQITEREGEKAIWSKIGVAFVNRDNSLNVILNMLPMNGRLHIREPKEKKGGSYAIACR